MISRNKGILSRNFLVPNLGLLFALIFVFVLYRSVITPRSTEELITGQLMAAQASDQPYEPPRSIYIVMKDPEQAAEVVLFIWAIVILSYKLWVVAQERKLLRHDFVRINQGERIIPDDALDRYKDLRSAVETTPTWGERLLPEFILAALHRFHATHSVQDAASAVKEHAELAADNLDSDLSLVRYIAWAIPAVGFIGTVRGIGDALAQADQAIKGDLSGVTSSLGLAFNSTLVALVLSVFLMFVMHMLQARQEGLILELQTYCREKLIDVMKVPSQEEAGTVL
jgi:biopolymer transport protein ExbB/TolQ